VGEKLAHEYYKSGFKITFVTYYLLRNVFTFSSGFTTKPGPRGCRPKRDLRGPQAGTFVFLTKILLHVNYKWAIFIWHMFIEKFLCLMVGGQWRVTNLFRLRAAFR